MILGNLVEEVEQWNTPIVGAFLLWKFTIGYVHGHPNGDAPVGLLHFIATPLLLNVRLAEPISNNRENLQSYVKSFESEKDSDLLVNIQDRILEKRKYTLASIDIAVSKGLLVWEVTSAKLHPFEAIKSPKRGNGLKPTLVKLGKKAEILGEWFSEHDVSTIATYLKVVL